MAPDPRRREPHDAGPSVAFGGGARITAAAAVLPGAERGYSIDPGHGASQCDAYIFAKLFVFIALFTAANVKKNNRCAMTITSPADAARVNPSAGKAALRLVPKPAIAATEDVDGRDSYAVTAVADIIDRSLHATIARFTLGLSPAALTKAYFDWAIHLAVSPGKQLQLVDKATRKAVRFANYAVRAAVEGGKTPCCIEPLPQDRRFDGADWQKPPYNFMAQAFLLQQQWWHNATTGIRGVTKHHEDDGGVRVAPDSRHGFAVEFSGDQSRSAPADHQQRRHEPGRRLAQSGGRLGAQPSAERSRSAPKISKSAATWRSRPARSSIAIG